MFRSLRSFLLGTSLLVSPALSDAAVLVLPGSPLNTVLASTSGGGTAVVDRGDNANQFEASGQTIDRTALDGDEIGIDALYLRVSDGTTLSADGDHALEIWVGGWDFDAGAPGEEVVRETFDVSGTEFVEDVVYGFPFSEPFDLDPAQDYAFQIWWTSEDASHRIAWDRDTGEGSVEGAFISDADPGLTIPFSANTTGTSSDLYFGFTSVPEPSIAFLIGMGALGLILVFRRR